jgi:hypothetical protein
MRSTSLVVVSPLIVLLGCGSSDSPGGTNDGDASTSNDVATNGDAASRDTGDGGTPSDTAAKLAISPRNAIVAQKGNAKFTCNIACTFTVQEGAAGGSVGAV